MNETTSPYSASDVPWPTSEHRARVPETSMLPGKGKVSPAMVGLLNHAVQGTHDTIDRLADRVEPAARQLGESVSAAEGAMHEKTDQLRETRDEWVESMRSAVRSNTLASIAAAVAPGAVIAHITRWRSHSALLS